MLRKNRFSLIEILVVMVIMTVLMTLMMPAFNHMLNGSKVDQMTSNIKLGLEQAQSRAVTDRKHVALVLPSKPANWHSDVKPYCYGGFRLAYVTDSGEFVRWVPGAEWKNAPNGAMLVKVEVANSGSLPSGDLSSDYIKKTNGSDSDSLLGAPLEDFTLPSSNAPTNILTGTTADRCLIIFDPYGMMLNSSMCLTIAEALVDGSNSLIFPSKKGNDISNILRLKIDQFTGKVEFLNL